MEFMGLHDENAAVTQVHFLPQQVKSAALLLFKVAPLVDHFSWSPESPFFAPTYFNDHLNGFQCWNVQVELVTLLEDNSLHMWTLRAHQGLSELLEIGRFTLTGPPG